MRCPIVVSFLIACAATTLVPAAQAAPPEKPAPGTASEPRVFLLDGKHLAAARDKLRGGDKSLQPALQKLQTDAHAAMKAGPFSVTTKRRTPPSGDKHDFMSLAPYWWPDPDKADGLPYVQRDGQRNPEIYEITDAGKAYLAENRSTVDDIFQRIADFGGAFFGESMLELSQAFKNVARATYTVGPRHAKDPERVRKIREILERAAKEIEEAGR